MVNGILTAVLRLSRVLAMLKIYGIMSELGIVSSASLFQLEKNHMSMTSIATQLQMYLVARIQVRLWIKSVMQL